MVITRNEENPGERGLTDKGLLGREEMRETDKEIVEIIMN